MDEKMVYAGVLAACALGLILGRRLCRRNNDRRLAEQLRRMETASHDSRELLAAAAELAHLGPWRYHYDKKLFEFDDIFYAIYATNVAREGAFMTPAEYTRNFVHPDDAGMVATVIEQVLQDTGRYVSRALEHRIIRRDGEVRTISVRIDVIKDEASNIRK